MISSAAAINWRAIALDHDLGVPAHVGRRCALPLQVDHGGQPADLLNLPGLLRAHRQQPGCRTTAPGSPAERLPRPSPGARRGRSAPAANRPRSARSRHRAPSAPKQVLLDLDARMLAAHACTLSRRYWPSFTFCPILVGSASTSKADRPVKAAFIADVAPELGPPLGPHFPRWSCQHLARRFSVHSVTCGQVSPMLVLASSR